jgi:3-deoxy-D-manno-octulosonic-acid transferase
MTFFYTIGLQLYGLGIRVASIASDKARKWVGGRKHLIARLRREIDPSRKWIWFHAASLGEFEQGRPLIEIIRKQHPDTCILLTFFSPSGYEVRKDYPAADVVCYMPLDTPINARQFVNTVNPILAVFVKYEIWYHHFNQLQKNGTPTLLISAQFRPEQFYFKWYGAFFKPVLRGLRQIFVADDTSLRVLEEHGFNNAELAGDTRIDRVIETSVSHRDFSYLRDILQSEHILVAGSTWPEDEDVVLPLLNKKVIKGIIAPHETDEGHLAKIESELEVSYCRLTNVTKNTRADVVIVDTIGDLAHIYHVATIAYVGGGFGSGIHNVLEAAVFGIPVIFGPNHERFAEAQKLISLKAASSISTAEEFENSFHILMTQSSRDQIREVLGRFFASHKGATARIYDYICRERLLQDELENGVS